MKKERKMFVYAVVSAILVVSWGAALAADGVTLIDQSTVSSPPFYIKKPGSYRLSGNLAAPNDFDDCLIIVSSSDVTLDLNGFNISAGARGGGICTGGEEFPRVEVRNGSITGGLGVFLNESSIVRNVRVTTPNRYNFAVGVGSYSIVEHNSMNGSVLILCPSVYSGNTNKQNTLFWGYNCVGNNNVPKNPGTP